MLARTIRALLPAPAVTIVRPLYHALWRGSRKAEWWFLDQFQMLRHLDPMPSARLRFKVGERSGIAVFQAVGEQTAKAIQSALCGAGYRLEDFRSVLDFGCGCGRTLVWLCKAFPGIEWHGTDVDAEAVQWCRKNIRSWAFALNGAAPPLSYRGETFDLVYAISVFTHLDRDAQRAWAEELHRVVKPGGIVLLTIHGESVRKELGEADAVEREGHVFRRSGKLRGILPDWYHTAFQSRDYTVKMLCAQFELVKYLPNACGGQDVVIVRRRD
jgi:SAM-dependent methyltransferase